MPDVQAQVNDFVVKLQKRYFLNSIHMYVSKYFYCFVLAGELCV